MRNVIRAGVAWLTGMVFLAGCSVLPVGPSTPSGTRSSVSTVQPQSQAEACLALVASLGTDASELPSVLSDLSSDPAKALKALRKVADNLAKASTTLTNPKVKAQADRLAKALSSLIVDVQKELKKPGDTGKLGKAADTVRTESAALGALCTGL